MENIYSIIDKIKNFNFFYNKKELEFKKPDAYKNINTSKMN